MEVVRELANILAEHGLTCLEYTSADVHVRLEKNISVTATTVSQIAAIEATGPSVSAEPQVSGTTVTAPLVGVVFRAREPGAPPLATVGSSVKKGDTLCIIEAMKMFSDIPSPCDGTVLEILFSDGELAEFGAPLLVIGQ